MSVADTLRPELRDLAEAVGLLDPTSGDVAPDWFDNPLDYIQKILKDPQLTATIKLLDDLLPPETVTGLAAGEEWRALLGTQPRGNVYLTTSSSGSTVVLGVAANFDSDSTSPGPSVSLRTRLPLVESSNGTVTFVAAQSQTPFSIELRVELDWSASGGNTLGLKAVRANVDLVLSPPATPTASITLEQLQLGSEPAADVVLDPTNLGPEAARLCVELLQQLPASQTGAVANYLLPLLGFGAGAGPAIPQFPLMELVHDPSAIQRWFAALAQDPAVLQSWMKQLAGLIGQATGALAIPGDGSVANPWAVQLFAFTGGGLDLTAALDTANGQTSLQLGARARYAPGAAPPVLQLEAAAVIAAIPLAGPGTAEALPSASVLVMAPATAPNPGPWISGGGFSINQVRAGLTLRSGSLQPLLELIDVTLSAGNSYPVIDLTNSNSVASTLTDALKNALIAALGGPAVHLAALAGLVKPQDDAGFPYSVDPIALAHNPARAIGGFHRQVLTDSTSHGWNHLLAELAALLQPGATVSVNGLGTPATPWTVSPALGTLGPLTLSLAAWNAQTAAGGDPQQLRLGLAAEVSQNPLTFTWLAELLAVDLPASGAGQLSLMAGQHAYLSAQPLPSPPAVAGMALTADSLTAGMDWQPGGSMQWTAAINNVQLQIGATAVTLGKLSFPLGSLDFSNPAAVATGLGITLANLELALRTLTARGALSWGGIPGLTLTHLFGLGTSLPGLQTDWPTLADPAGVGTLFSDPFSAFRNWLGKIAFQLSSDGTPFAFPLLAWLQSLLSGTLPVDLNTPPALIGVPIDGSGTYDDPWSLPLSSDTPSPADLLVWLDAAGGLTTPPAAWVTNVAGQITAATDFDALVRIVRLLAPFVPPLRLALAGRGVADLAVSLDTLSGHLATSDGVVPTDSQSVTAPHWTTGTPLSSPHHRLPQDPLAINQIKSQITTWGNNAVLLIGPAFGSHTDWQGLITAAGATTANLNLRVPGVDPTTIDLGGVTTPVTYYTADLKDDGSGNLASLIGQIAHVVARIRQLNGSQPVILVAHSTAGVPAREFTFANPTLVQGLITLGTPHQGAPLPFLTDAGAADAVRFLQPLLPSAAGNDTIAQALGRLVQAIDGYQPPASAGQLPVAAPYPAGSFNFSGATHIDTGGPPALALVSALGGSLAATVQNLLTTLAGVAAAPNPAPPAPTHVGLGVRTRLDFSAPLSGEVQVDSYVRVDAFRARLVAGAADPPQAPQALHVRARLSRPDDWLLGAASPFAGLGVPPIDVRVRWAELGADILPASSGLRVTPVVQLYDASYHSPIGAPVGWGDAQAQALLGAVLQGISSPSPRTGSPADLLLSAFTSLGIAAPLPSPQTGIGISADAFAAITADAAGFLAPRVKSAISAGGLPGISGPISGSGGGPFTITPGTLPLELYLSPSPWTVGVRTSAGSSLTLAANASLSFNGSVQLPAFTPSFDAALTIGTLSLAWSQSAKALTVQSPCLDAVQLYPPSGASVLTAALNSVLPRILFSASASAALESLLSPGVTVGPLDCIFHHTGQSVAGSSGLGNGSGGLDGSKIALLLQAINTALGGVAGPGITLPSNLQLTASGTGTAGDPTKLQLATTPGNDIGGVLGLTLGISFDNNLHITPFGSATLTINGLGGNPWNSVQVTFGLSGKDVTLSVTPTPGDAIQILPKFSGFGSLLAVAEALLPEALDALVSVTGTTGTVAKAVLTIATDLNLYDDTGGGFAARTSEWQALLQGGLRGFAGTVQQNAATHLAAFLSAQSFTGISATNNQVTWTYNLTAGVGSGSIAATLGWDTLGQPLGMLQLTGFQPSSSGLILNFTGGFQQNALALSLDVSFSLNPILSIPLFPRLSVNFDGHALQVQFFPLATDPTNPTKNGSITVKIAPTPGVSYTGPDLRDLIDQFLLPLVANVVWNVHEINARSNHSLWTLGGTPGPTLAAVLSSVGILSAGKISWPSAPDFGAMALGLIKEILTTPVSLNVTDSLTVELLSDGTGYGIRLKGKIADIPVGDLSLAVLFGSPPTWMTSDGGTTSSDSGITLYLLNRTASAFNLALDIGGLGMGLSGQGDAPLINTSAFRLGGVRAYFFLNIKDLLQGQSDSFGGGLELDAIGIPLGQATSGAGSGNPVVSSLLSSGGGGGDQHSVNPGVDVGAWYRNASEGDGNFHITFNQQQDKPLWISVHAGFGPIFIDQVGLELTPDPGMTLLIDGSVKVNGFTAQADELGVTIPFKALKKPDQWILDLKGLAVGFQSAGVTVAGGLYKKPTPPVEYDGMLAVQVAEFGLIAVGAYSKPQDYTSLFLFLAAFIPIPVPPVLDIEGLGLGFGYNREIIVPDDLNKIPDFPLVAALTPNGASAFANDPMGELMQLGVDMPPRRGSFWGAAGAYGTTYQLIHITAVVYVALDRGVEVGVIGVARMALPSDVPAELVLVNVELAVKARFSTAEGILSVQAQLTDNSYLFSRDCQLTGGFAFFVWFPQFQAVLTLGGYHPSFNKPAQFPDVPRLGYHWPIPPTMIKGEAYHAVTNTCVMIGGRLEVAYGLPILNVWFHAYADVLVSWEPFYYTADVGVSIGATFSIQACAFGFCVEVSVTVSVGSTLALSGPPLHGEVSVDLDVGSVTIPFGPDPPPQPNFLDWGTFKTKYLLGGDDTASGVSAHVVAGVTPPQPSGAQPSPGTQNQPWKFQSEFTLRTSTNMPARSYIDFTDPGTTHGVDNTYQLDLAPMNVEDVSSTHQLTLYNLDAGSNWVQLQPDGSHFTFTPVMGQVSDATWHYYDPSQVPAAANTLPEMTGLKITASVFIGKSSPAIPIATLVDDGNPRPLPFASPDDIPTLKQYGSTADEFAIVAAGANQDVVFRAVAGLVSGSGFFSQARVNAGLPAGGLSPIAVRSFTHRRSAPPLLTPLTTGLTMKPVGQQPPPKIAHPTQVVPVALESPRLRAVLQSAPSAVADAPVTARTTAATIAPVAPRMRPPVADTVAGAKLVRVRAANAPRPTLAPHSGTTLRNAEIGWSPSVAQLQALEQAATALVADGITVTAGATHIWDLPVMANALLELSGDAARIVFLTRGGNPIIDREFIPGKQLEISIPANAAMLAVAGLGRWPDNMIQPAAGFGVLSNLVAPSGTVAATGWQAASRVAQAGATTLLARGASVLLAQAHLPVRGRARTAQALVGAAAAMATQVVVETRLPLQVRTIMLLLDQQGGKAAATGDFAIAANGATLAVPPLRVVGGNRRALLYDVSAPSPDSSFISVTAGSTSAWRLSGVVGLQGDARSWAARLNGAVPPTIVPQGPFTVDGSTRVKLIIR